MARRQTRGTSAEAPQTFEVSARVERQALTQPYLRPKGAPATRPLKIFTLDPSVSHRVGGVATVNVPYERLKPGPVGSLFQIDPTGAPKSWKVEPLDLEDP